VYDGAHQMLVTGRALDGHVGYLVLTALRVTDDGTGGASWANLSGAPVLPVVRGWVASPSDAPALGVPPGQVRVTGWVQTGESTSGAQIADNPDGPALTDAIAPSALVNDWGGPIWGGYLVLTSSDPAQAPAGDGGPALLPRPVLADGSGGFNIQSLFYAIEWVVFAVFALGFYLRLVRDEAAADRLAALGAEPGAGPGDGEPGATRRGGVTRGGNGIAGLPG
jgi:cytochrome oxidase assembly protein ShyY1